jgi:hypothetical protein
MNHRFIRLIIVHRRQTMYWKRLLYRIKLFLLLTICPGF